MGLDEQANKWGWRSKLTSGAEGASEQVGLEEQANKWRWRSRLTSGAGGAG